MIVNTIVWSGGIEVPSVLMTTDLGKAATTFRKWSDDCTENDTVMWVSHDVLTQETTVVDTTMGARIQL